MEMEIYKTCACEYNNNVSISFGYINGDKLQLWTEINFKS
jgi:hypothetical protein